jgi:hypothetical protein
MYLSLPLPAAQLLFFDEWLRPEQQRRLQREITGKLPGNHREFSGKLPGI